VLAPLDWAVLALLPLATALIAMIAARITVMRALARMV
jgi:cell division transport system permease protein